jgi:hypothetical protein
MANGISVAVYFLFGHTVLWRRAKRQPQRGLSAVRRAFDTGRAIRVLANGCCGIISEGRHICQFRENQEEKEKHSKIESLAEARPVIEAEKAESQVAEWEARMQGG